MAPIKRIVTLAVAAMIAGCGSGGGGGDSAPFDDSLTIQGDAVKGPISQANISLYKTAADGQQGDLLKETTSDSKGHYSLTAKGYSGVVLLIASAVPGTTMFDEATGQTIVPATGFRLRASFPVESGKPHSAQINPFTDLATATALAKTGGLTATNVDQANTDLAAALTFNPLTSAATFDVNNKPTNAPAAALAAVSDMALSGSLNCATGDQAVKVACVTTALSAKGLSDTGMKSALQTSINRVNDFYGLPAFTITDSSGTPLSAATPLEQAKDFMGTLRSNAKALDAADLSLQTELQKVGDDIRGRTAPLTSANVDALNVARLGADFWNDVIKGNAPFVVTQRVFNGYEYPATCSFYKDANYTAPATSKADANYVACHTAFQPILATDANGEYKRCVAVGEWCDTTWTYRVSLHPDLADANKFTVYTQTRETKYTAKTFAPSGYVNNWVPSEIKHYGAAFPGNLATLATQRDGNGKITALKLAGELSPAFSITRNWTSRFDSVLKRWVYKPNVVATLLGDKHNVALSAALTKLGELDKLAVSGSMDLIKAGALESRIELAEGSYLQAKPDGTSGYSAQDGSQEMLLKLKGSTTGSTLAGDLKISAFKLDASSTSYIPTLVSFAGSVQRNGVSFFEGTLTGEALNHASFKSNASRSASNVQIMRAGFDGKVTIANRPVLKVKLSVTQNDTGSDATNTTALNGQYAQGLIVINMTGAGSAAANSITLESTRGVKLVIDKSKTTYPLTKSGQVVGEYSTLNNRITYTDSSYEQF
ncbi:hypothetical protein [Polaromonas sp.]|uniref:hypothetical protein n=1 Tax=Polaromonas sp. TaxID=1869339 RepID=UPI0017B8E020|nr:hypothetical protein [Polaromonas sp.]NMM07945.1 hypothetical protein [Polaromonas sp.]